VPQPRVPKGTPTKGNVRAGEFAAKKPRGRVGSPVPPSAPIHQAASDRTSQSAREREQLAAEHASRLPDEMAGDFKCVNCGWAGWREHPVVTREGKMHATLAFQGCSRCGTMHVSHVGIAGKHSPQFSTRRAEAARPTRTADAATGAGSVPANARSSTRLMRSSLGKTVDTAETGLLRQDLAGDGLVQHRKQCPRGGDGQCGKAVKGRCSRCDAPVRDHEALGKLDELAETVDVLKRLAGP
jgi:hypothetical protein